MSRFGFKMKTIDVPNHELQFLVESDLEEYRANSIFEKEPETIEWINRFSGNSCFFDIGANIGIYTLYSVSRHHDLGVFAFEPVSNNYASLLRNVWANKYATVKSFHMALSDRECLTELFLSDLRIGNSGAQINSSVDEKGCGFEALRVESVLCVSVDRLIQQFGFPVPNYVKIDVDGHESDILNGMTSVLRSESFRSLLVEFNSQDQFMYWKERLAAAGLALDHGLDDVPNHSGVRRQSKGSVTRNYIFSRPD